MGFLSGPGMAGAAGGANQALQNFLNFYMQNKELKQRKDIEKERFDEQVRLRKATEAHQTGMMGISQSRENRELRAAEDAATQQLREQMAVQPMPQYPAVPQGMAGGPEAYPEMPGPMGDMDQIRALMQVNPGKYAGTFGQLIKPVKKNYTLKDEEKLDKATGITFKRSFFVDPETKEKSDYTDWVPIKAKAEKAPLTPTDKDKLYDSYVDQIKATGQKPMARYQFDIWLAKQKPSFLDELREIMIESQGGSGTKKPRPITDFDKR